MEHIIAKLLRDFESGFMNRRQLISSLALAATAASAVSASGATVEQAAASATAKAPKGKPPAFMTVELDHISYQVVDYKKTRDFYADLMGMDVANDNGSSCELKFGNSLLLARNKRAAAPGASPAANPQGVTSLVDHLAYRIYSWDTDKVREELVRRGLATTESKSDTGGGPNYSSFHVKDPDGYNLQISGWACPTDAVNQKKPGA